MSESDFALRHWDRDGNVYVAKERLTAAEAQRDAYKALLERLVDEYGMLTVGAEIRTIHDDFTKLKEQYGE